MIADRADRRHADVGVAGGQGAGGEGQDLARAGVEGAGALDPAGAVDDITAWLPGLARTSYDDLADDLEAAAGPGQGRITAEAGAALTTARAALRPGRWRRRW